jgi:hypothetical protein
MERGFRERVGRLLGDYTPSYDPDGAEYEYLMAPGGDNDPYSGPFYRTSAEASEAADIWRSYIGYCHAGIHDYEGRARRADERIDAALAGLEPIASWRRRRHSELLNEIAEARNGLEETAHRTAGYASAAKYAGERIDTAEWIAGALQRAERAHEAAVDAAAQVLGWRPGEPVTTRRLAFRAGWSGVELVACTSAAAQVNAVAPVTEGVRPGSQPSVMMPLHPARLDEGSHRPQPRIRLHDSRRNYAKIS